MNPLVAKGIAIGAHQLRRTIGVLCVLAVIAGLGWSVYRTFIKPPDTVKTEQKNTIRNVKEVRIDQRQIHPIKVGKCNGLSLGPFCVGFITHQRVEPETEVIND